MIVHSEIDNSDMAHDPLAQVLKRAAESERPVFCENLYSQTLERVARLADSHSQSSAHRSRSSYAILKRIGWFALAAYATVVTIAVLIQFVQKYQGDHWNHQEVSAADSNNLHKAYGKSETVTDGDPLAKEPPTEAIEQLVSVPDRTVQHMQVALSQIDRQRWANLDHDLRLAGELLHHQLPWGVLSRAEGSDVKTP